MHSLSSAAGLVTGLLLHALLFAITDNWLLTLDAGLLRSC